MTALSEADYQKVLSFLQRLYAPGSPQDFSARVLATIQDLVAADIPGYCEIDFTQAQFLDGAPLPQMADNRVKEVSNQYLHEHPFMAHYLETRDCRACKLSDLVSEQQLHDMEGVYQRFLRPMQMEEQLNLTLPHENSSTANAVVLFRTERSFTERDRTILNLLLPHLLQARQTAHVFSQMQQENQQLHSSLNAAGGIVISREGRIKFMTRKAEQWLKRYFPLKRFGQALPEHLQKWVKYQQSLFQRDGSISKVRLPLKIEQDDKQLVARFLVDPEQDQYLLLLEEQQQLKLSSETFELLGLSRREAEILYWVAQGKENSEIAEILYIGLTTVRKHLEHIYQKLEVRTRAAAVVKALRGLGMLTCE